MRRIVLLFLLCVLPLQFALAAPLDAFKHAGGDHHHHTLHSHELDAELTSDSPSVSESSVRSHVDSGGCHHHLSIALLDSGIDFIRPHGTASVEPLGRETRHRDATTERPERPNWSVLV